MPNPRPQADGPAAAWDQYAAAARRLEDAWKIRDRDPGELQLAIDWLKERVDALARTDHARPTDL